MVKKNEQGPFPPPPPITPNSTPPPRTSDSLPSAHLFADPSTPLFSSLIRLPPPFSPCVEFGDGCAPVNFVWVHVWSPCRYSPLLISFSIAQYQLVAYLCQDVTSSLRCTFKRYPTVFLQIRYILTLILKKNPSPELAPK